MATIKLLVVVSGHHLSYWDKVRCRHAAHFSARHELQNGDDRVVFHITSKLYGQMVKDYLLSLRVSSRRICFDPQAKDVEGEINAFLNRVSRGDIIGAIFPWYRSIRIAFLFWKRGAGIMRFSF